MIDLRHVEIYKLSWAFYSHSRPGVRKWKIQISYQTIFWIVNLIFVFIMIPVNFCQGLRANDLILWWPSCSREGFLLFSFRQGPQADGLSHRWPSCSPRAEFSYFVIFKKKWANYSKFKVDLEFKRRYSDYYFLSREINLDHNLLKYLNLEGHSFFGPNLPKLDLSSLK